MRDNFEFSLNSTLKHEGGWTDSSEDFPTMKGIRLTTYRQHYGKHKTKDDLRNISDKELNHIYKTGYWDKCNCDNLPAGLNYVVFDAAVNSGPSRSAKWLQKALGVERDGVIGPITLGKIKTHDLIQLIHSVCDKRLNFLHTLGNWPQFGKGWGRRIEEVRNTSITMSRVPPQKGTLAELELPRVSLKSQDQDKIEEALRLKVHELIEEIETQDHAISILRSDNDNLRQDLRRHEVKSMGAIPAKEAICLSEDPVPAMMDFDEEVEWIMGRPNFWCASIAEVLRKSGDVIGIHAEEEQAAVIYWMLCQYMTFGKEWRGITNRMLKGVDLEFSIPTPKGT